MQVANNNPLAFFENTIQLSGSEQHVKITFFAKKNKWTGKEYCFDLEIETRHKEDENSFHSTYDSDGGIGFDDFSQEKAELCVNKYYDSFALDSDIPPSYTILRDCLEETVVAENNNLEGNLLGSSSEATEGAEL